MSYTSDDLVLSVQRGITLPNYQPLLSTADILALADEEISTRIVPLMTSLEQEFFVTTTLVTIVNGQDSYPIPARSIGRTLRDLKIQDPSGNRRDLMYVMPENEHLYTTTGGDPSAFFFRGDQFVIRPSPQLTGTYSLEVWYMLRPSKLVSVSTAATITAINTGTNTITLSNSISLSVGSSLDFISAKGGHSIIAFDQAVTVLSFVTQPTFASLPSTLAVGDYVSLAQTTPVIQLPDDLFQVLAQATQCRILEAIGDTELLTQAKGTLKEKMVEAQKLFSPRVEGARQKVSSTRGLLRRPFPLTRRFF